MQKVIAVVCLLAIAVSAIPTKKPIDALKAVAQHYGYINVNSTYNANLFYWMFESQGNPSSDPVVLWMTGGPGCSSELALFFENGPYTVNGDMSLTPNPYSWNKFANLLYIDQPAGTGFSYANSDYVHDEAQVGQEMYVFLQKFFAMYPQYTKQDFFVVGESYGGHYVPTVGYWIIKGNQQNGNFKINLKGVSIGNGWVNPEIQYGAYGPFAYQNNLISSSVYASMNQTYATCKQQIDAKKWDDADYTCSNIMGDVLQAAGNLNVYNIDLQCNPAPLCYDFSNITNYLNQPSVLAKLGVPSNVQWSTCSDDVNEKFTVDRLESYSWEVPFILENNVPVVIYNGDLDLICNWVGGYQWTNALPWSGQRAFNAAATKKWNVGTTAAGTVQSANGLTFVRVFQAGHMVPHDQPKNALSLLQHVVNNAPFA